MFLFVNTKISSVDAGLNQSRMKRSHVRSVYPDESVPLPWLILRTRAKKESCLASQLIQRGFDAWLPEVKRFRIRAGKKEFYPATLIPGYVFVRLQCSVEPEKFNLSGFSGMLQHDGRPATLRHEDALRLDRICSLDVAPEVTTDFCCGQKVTIRSGALKGLSGTVSRTDGRRFLVVESGINGIMLKIDMARNVVE
ncbi:Transcription antitermination protein RfaH [bioreactor metagenome]|uniref:Transcription antitermination protein RfaH n=1 Tax=bioreactor metagenome TaxID=1076179 RepID=A0A644VST1_9ZZZZ